MVRGLYTSATGMLVQQKMLDVISNNIANATTTGYKKDGVLATSFEEELTRKLSDNSQVEGYKITHKVGDMSLGSYVKEVYTDFSATNLKQTDGSLDLAIDGDGFFVINVINRNGDTTEKYTRDGSFTLGRDGSLMTQEGNYVQGENGNIVLPTGYTSISRDGTITVNGEAIDKIKIIAFEDNSTLRKDEDNLITITDDSRIVPFNGNIEQGYLEGSNVDSVEEMVKMIRVMRNYEANQKLVQIHDQTLGKAVNDIGK